MTGADTATDLAAERLSMPLGEAIFTLRAIRRFKPDPVSDGDLRTVLEAAIRAPNGGNAQRWHFLVVRDPQRRRQLGELYWEGWCAKRREEGFAEPEDIPEDDRVRQSAMRLASHYGEAPVIVLFCATRRDPATMASIVPAVQNLLLSARAIGIGGTITRLHTTLDGRLRELFAIPEDAEIVYAIPLGRPEGRFGPVTRKPLSEVSSLDVWGKPLVAD